MKLRREARGLHCYDRVTGLHLLLDESPVPSEIQDEGPATVSVALTNRCDLSCAFCYAPKSRHTLSAADVIRWCTELAGIGTLDVAFGGGEPTLFPDLPELCRAIWCETDLGVSITTHGHHLTHGLVKALQGSVSVVRASIDALEPRYSSIRGRPLQLVLENIERLGGRIPLGINTVINSTTLPRLDELAVLVKRLRAVDWLLPPEVHRGEFTMRGSEWLTLDDWIAGHRLDFELRVTAEASAYLKGPFLLGDQPEDYAHISADRYLRRCSYTGGGVMLREGDVLTALRELREQERCRKCETEADPEVKAIFRWQ